jgi:hypothetical protein
MVTWPVWALIGCLRAENQRKWERGSGEWKDEMVVREDLLGRCQYRVGKMERPGRLATYT